MKQNCGNELLIPRSQWVAKEKIQGDEIKTLRSRIIERAFQEILKMHKPKHKIALVSLCTATRPYSKSRKWKEFIRLFGKDADMIICSNGGIIPIEFENCYPYLTYDAHGEGKWDKLYITVCYRRLNEFFSTFHYDKIILNFRPNMRNRIAAQAFKKNYKGNSEIIILPTVAAYEKARKAGFPRGKMFPDLDDNVLMEIKKEMRTTQCIKHNRI